ncbi:transcription factor Adf-1-like [Gymnodraco acuticeps]|uniref:Transcription factor Adf-1-like n=1 Tax=Gymnodraco acuticeps TaxID=8218 RepID=A0A6P8XA35_GYMAC|nr:transcription factor Adf-1-like [Gymnodraco acuticeps]
MEDKLIIAVANVPVLYDCTLFTYRDLNRRNQAWREVAETVGETDNVCKKRWKSLRDRFRKENNMEKEAKRSGAGSAGGYKPWRFMAVMGFLTPFIIDRETSSNVPRQTLPPSTLVAEEESQVDSESASQSTNQSASQPAAVSQEENAEVRGKTRGRGREMSPFERSLLSAVSNYPAIAQPTPPVVEEDEDLQFFKSLLHTMRQMTKAQRARVRLGVHQIIFDVDQQDNL